MTVSVEQRAESEEFGKLLQGSALGLAVGVSILHGIVAVMGHRITWVS